MTSDRGNAYVDDISYQCDDSPVLNPEKSQIAEWFAHTNILVTGGTGFLGKLIIEKLLRSCPDIATIYVIVRPKKGKSSEQRFNENFEDAVYDRLRREQPNFLNKVIMVEGDAMQDDYGLSPETKTMLMNTNIIFHAAAATVRFDAKMRLAVNINVKSTKYLLLFAKQMPNLKGFVYVSTAFSNCIQKCIDEIHYRPPIDGDNLISLLDIFDGENIEQITPTLLQNWPNMYIFSKAVAESIVAKYSEGIPTCIVRPSIVTSTAEEPLVGWINNLYGATGLIVGGGLGVLHTVHSIPENMLEIIPADYVVSTIIAAAWNISNRTSAILDEDANIAVDERIPIYNSVSTCQNPITCDEFLKLCGTHGTEIPSMRCMWYYIMIINRHLIVHKICAFFLHFLPATIIDTSAYIVGRKPMLVDMYKKLQKFSNVFQYFTTQEWNFCDDNVQKLWQGLNSTDKEIFKFNIKNLDWNEYIYGNVRGIRVYLLNESPDTVEAARRRYQKLKIAHYTIMTLIFLVILWVTVYFLSSLWSLCPLAQ